MSRPQSPEQPDRVADVVQKREALEDLLTSEGWQYLLSHVAHEWEGSGYKARMRQALSNDITDAKVVDRTAQEIFRLLQWPSDQVRDLKGSVGDE